MRWMIRVLVVAGLLAAPSAPVAAQAALAGVVTEDTTGRPVASAEVWIEALGRMTRTDENGRYAMSGLTPGMRVVQVRLIGYHPVSRMVQLVAGETRQADITLQRAPAQLDTVVAQSQRPLLPSFEENQRAGLGRFLTRADLEKVEGRRLADVLRDFPGLGVVGGMGGNRAWVASSRGIKSLSSLGERCQSWELDGGNAADQRLRKCNCYLHVYLDDMPLFRGAPGELVPDINRFAPEEIEAIEFYAGPAQTPLRYSTLNSTCGVLVIHTRRTPGRSDEKSPPVPPEPDDGAA